MDQLGLQSQDSATQLVPIVSSSVHLEPGFDCRGQFDDVETSGHLSCQDYSQFRAWRHHYVLGMSYSFRECSFTDVLEVPGTPSADLAFGSC